MVKQTQFHVQLRRSEAESLTMNYFLLHKYYRLQSEDGLRFRTYLEMQSVLSPSRLNESVNVDITETGTGCLVKCTFNLVDERITSIDEEYFEAFLEHFRQALLQRKITMFSGEKFEQESKRYSKIYWWVIAAVSLSALVITWFLKLDFLFFGIAALSPTVAIWIVNRKRKRQEKSS